VHGRNLGLGLQSLRIVVHLGEAAKAVFEPLGDRHLSNRAAEDKLPGRAMNIYAVQNTTISNTLKDASLLVKRVGRKWKFTRRVWPVARKVPIFGPIVLNRALSVVRRDTERLRSCLESDGLIDKKSLEEARNISLAIRQAAERISSVAAKRSPSSPQPPA
jgi:hypothetical protein